MSENQDLTLEKCLQLRRIAVKAMKSHPADVAEFITVALQEWKDGDTLESFEAAVLAGCRTPSQALVWARETDASIRGIILAHEASEKKKRGAQATQEQKADNSKMRARRTDRKDGQGAAP